MKIRRDHRRAAQLRAEIARWQRVLAALCRESGEDVAEVHARLRRERKEKA